MHRQSLGSPASKPQCHGVLFSGAGAINDGTDNNFISEDLRKDKSASSSDVDEERKSPKSNQHKSILVHLIPLLTFFCFLILYLSSHDPSTKDLAQVSGFTKPNTVLDSVEIDNNNISGGSMAIRSMRNLQQQEQHRLHRKIRH